MGKLKRENGKIARMLYFLEHAPYSETKQYQKDILGNGAKIDGYIYQRSCYCWLIWKPTDLRKNPEWKGEPLLKEVPDNVVSYGKDVDSIVKVLEAQPWVYV